jgi:hypothetical protein
MRLAAFAGNWALVRDIVDRRGGAAGRFEGCAEFRPVSGGLAYREAGVLRLGAGAPMQATRRYLWCDRAEHVEVRFGDGGFFHRFALGDPAPAAVHECPPDRYRVRYDFGAWPVWRAEWRVTGPRKDYSSVTTYARRDPPSGAAPSTEGAGEG